MRIVTRVTLVTIVLTCAPALRARDLIQGRAASSTATQAPLTWDRVLIEMSRLEAAGDDAAVTALLERFLKTTPKRFEPYVALAHAYEKQGRFDQAAETLRKARRAVPDMPAMFVLQLTQYDVQQVTESQTIPRPDAARLLAEAAAVADGLIAAKQQVRMAMLAKSLALKLQAERVEQTPARKQAVMAESDRLAEQARFTNNDGSPIAKTVDDEWMDLQAAFVGPTPGPPSGPALEKFVAAHPDFAPARLSLGFSYQDLGDAMTDPAAQSAPARMKLFQDADAQFERAAALAHERPQIAAAIGARIGLRRADRLNKRSEGETMARAAFARYPDQPQLVISLASILLPRGEVPTDAAIRTLREMAPAEPEVQHAVGTYLWDMVSKNKALPRPVAAKVLTEAHAAIDAALKLRPDYVEAIVYKSLLLRLQAERVEQDPARRAALVAEADRLTEQAKKLRSAGK